MGDMSEWCALSIITKPRVYFDRFRILSVSLEMQKKLKITALKTGNLITFQKPFKIHYTKVDFMAE